MEWAKRNQYERNNNDREKKELDLEKQSLLSRETEYNDHLKRLKRREYDEIAKKTKILEGKKELLNCLKREEAEFNVKCNQMEEEIKSIDGYVKSHMDIQENLDLKMLGLELSEDLWRKKWEDQ